MKKLVFLLLAASMLMAADSKVKIRIKSDVVYADEQEYLKIEKDEAFADGYKIITNKGEQAIYLRYKSFNDTKQISQSNPKGTVRYYEVLDPNTFDLLFEHDFAWQNLFKALLVDEAVLLDGTINQDKLSLISKKFGMEFTRMRSELCD